MTAFYSPVEVIEMEIKTEETGQKSFTTNDTNKTNDTNEKLIKNSCYSSISVIRVHSFNVIKEKK